MKFRILICCLVFMWGTTTALEHTLSGRVFRVLSGDQLVLIDSENALYSVRLAGIRAPGPGRPFASEARTHLQAMLLGRVINVHFQRRDAGQPILGRVTYGGADVSLRQIQAGLARLKSDHGLSDTRRRQYLQAENRARAAGQGMWRDRMSPAPVGRPR